MVTPPLLLAPKSMDHAEKVRNSTHLMDAWVNKSLKKANKFVRDIMKILDRVVRILRKTQALMVAFDTFVYTRDFTIPILQEIRKMPRQILVKEGILKDGQSPDFLHWSNLLRMRKVIFGDINNGCNQVDEAIHLIHNKFVEVAQIILEKKLDVGMHIDINWLEERLKVIFHGTDGLITKKQLNDIHVLMVLVSKTRDFGLLRKLVIWEINRKTCQ